MRERFFNKIFKKFGFEVLKIGDNVEMVGMKEIKILRRVFGYFCFLLLFWGLYRLIFILPENVDEIFLKPIIWLGSLFWIVRKTEKKPFSSLGFSGKNLFKSLYLGLGLGVFFALEGILVNLIKYGELNLPPVAYSGWAFISAFLVSFLTGFSEEIVFRGFIFNRLWQVWKKEWHANLVTSILFVLIHLPITIFVFHYHFYQALSYAFIVFIYSLGAGFVFARTQTIIAPVLLHLFWTWPVVLFR